MSIESKLRELENDAERGEKIREKLGDRLSDLNSDLADEVSELVSRMFTSDKQFERAIRKRIDAAADDNKEHIFTQDGKKFRIGDIDPKRVAASRSLTDFEKAKLDRVGEVISDISTQAKAVIGTARRHRALLDEFEKEANNAASDLRKQVRKIIEGADTDQQRSEARTKVAELEDDISDFERRASRLSSAESALEDMQNEAVRLMRTADSAERLVKRVTNRSDLEDILTAASGGFGISAIVAGLLGSMGTAGILAFPALVAFATSRVVKIVNDIRGK